jgi:hypothetical protein
MYKIKKISIRNFPRFVIGRKIDPFEREKAKIVLNVFVRQSKTIFLQLLTYFCSDKLSHPRMNCTLTGYMHSSFSVTSV